jgi:transcriptional regulator with XRE-family HTH domain
MPEKRLIDFGQRVKAVRDSLHLLQKDFAAQIGISGSFLSDIEAGKTRASFEFFYHITKVYNVNPMFLLHGKGEMFLKGDNEPAIDYGPDSDFIREMIDHMRQIPVIRFAVLEFYQRYLFDINLL